MPPSSFFRTGHASFLCLCLCPFIKALCRYPLGMEDGRIPNSSITASSYLNDSYAPKHARVGNKLMWCAAKDKENTQQWLQVDLARVVKVLGVGSEGDSSRNVLTYKISYSQDGSSWAQHTALLNGNNDGSLKRNYITALLARYIIVHPQTWKQDLCMKIEIYGCPGCELESLGVREGGKVPDSSFSSSSYSPRIHSHDPLDHFAPHQGRLNNARSWCANSTQQNKYQWLQVDFGESTTISGVAVQGKWVRRVTSYYVKSSDDDVSWIIYGDSGPGSAPLSGSNRTTTIDDDVVQNWLFPVQARYIRFNPQTWKEDNSSGNYLFICMRVEVYGCNQDYVSVSPPYLTLSTNTPKVTITCKMEEMTVKRVRWTKDGKDISDGDEHKAGSLLLKRGSLGHFEGELKVLYIKGATMVKKFTKNCVTIGRFRTCTSEYRCIAFINDQAKVQSSTVSTLNVRTEYPDVPIFIVGDITSSTVMLSVTASLGDSYVIRLDVIYYLGSKKKSLTFKSVGDHVISGLSPYSGYEIEVKLFTDLTPDGVKSSKKYFKTMGDSRPDPLICNSKDGGCACYIVLGIFCVLVALLGAIIYLIFLVRRNKPHDNKDANQGSRNVPSETQYAEPHYTSLVEINPAQRQLVNQDRQQLDQREGQHTQGINMELSV